MEYKVGQKVYLKAVGNAARYHKKLYYEEHQVEKVGRKYVTVNGIQFDKERNYVEVSNYSASWGLYDSKQAIIDEEESKELYRDIKRELDKYGYFGKPNQTLNQLRRIKAILDENNR